MTSESENVNVGDRWVVERADDVFFGEEPLHEEWRAGDVLEVAGAPGKFNVSMRNLRTGRVAHGFMPSGRPWRRLPPTQPTVGVGPQPGDVVRDPGLLREGMVVQGMGMLDPRTIGANGRPTEGGWHLDHNISGWLAGVREDGVRILSLPTDTPATEGAAPPQCQERLRGRPCQRLAGHPGAHEDLIGCKWGVDMAAAPEPVKSVALPFKRHRGCMVARTHIDGQLCVNCERIIAEDMDNRLKPTPPQRPRTGPPEPMRSGLGTIHDTYRHQLPYASNARK